MKIPKFRINNNVQTSIENKVSTVTISDVKFSRRCESGIMYKTRPAIGNEEWIDEKRLEELKCG